MGSGSVVPANDTMGRDATFIRAVKIRALYCKLCNMVSMNVFRGFDVTAEPEASRGKALSSSREHSGKGPTMLPIAWEQ
ncbi:hypothetical protein EVAR_6671_1 [Eumeta japonica]|uniref:Uncharacterized protein n=1 Tax=Eumeta variegata TaxID=151549 RepID=A0A4C1TNA1_EUMVA|nr:hypothetical protein EVAR_6671_1 [Eumeta japonica]